MSKPQPSSVDEKVPWWVALCRRLWKLSAFFGGSVVMALLVNVGSTWLTSPGGKLPNDAPVGVIARDWQLVVLVGVCLLLLAALFWNISCWKRSAQAPPLTPQDRARMLGRLRVRYEQLLTQTLQDAVRVDVGLTSRPAAIQSTASLALHLPTQPDHQFPPQTSIADVYEQAHQELLILGEPGAGKSTLLLELAHHLLQQAEQDETQPLPLVVPLSSWASRRLPLQEWLVGQVKRLYDVPLRLSRQWVEAERVLPLLDGLDEMEEGTRSACVAAINTYHRNHLHPLVVCSRTNEYEHAVTQERLALHTAVVVQPLSQERVEAYLVSLGKPLVSLRSALKRNATLAALATTPLMLQILILTYQGTAVRQLSHKEAIFQEQIWRAYIERMVEQKGDIACYPLDRTLRWLTWLARLMRDRSTTILVLEELQPDILPKQYALLYTWSVILISGLLVGLLTGLLRGLLVGLLFGLLGGLLCRILIRLMAGKIEPVERITFSWEGLRERLLMGLLSGLLVGLLIGLLEGLLRGLLRGLLTGLLVGLLTGLLFVLLFVLVRGLQTEQLTRREILSANEGMRRSFTHGLLLLLVGGVLSMLLIGLVSVLLVGLHSALVFMLLSGLGIGLIIGLFEGLFAPVQHYTLRFWLWRAHLFPWKLVPFLEDATKRSLLRRVGGSYSFTHRLLLEYLADLDLSSLDASPPSQIP